MASQEDFKESPLEKLQSPKMSRPKVYNWGLIISVIFAIILFFLGLYLYSIFFPDNSITTLVAVQIIFLVFILFFVVYSIFAIYHAIRFGFEGDMTIISLAIYLIISAVIIVFTWNKVF